MLAMYFRLPYRSFFGNFFIYKNLHIEPFNHAINSFDFCSTNVGNSVIRTGSSEGSRFYPTSTGFDVITL